MDHSSFIAAPKSILIAPAGHGKTHAITDCLLHTKGKQLILTHTHAGIASIKEKIRKAKIPGKLFQLETITGYAQKYVSAFYSGNEMPEMSDGKKYYSFLIKKATTILQHPLIKKSVFATYSGLFVDEYQDCTADQHKLISALSAVLPTHILGDPLQGIFEFNNVALVDMTDEIQMAGFIDHQQTLEKPWRWAGNNEELGKALQEIRSRIIAHEKIDLKQFPAIERLAISDPRDIYIPSTQYYRAVSSLLSEKNLLLIHPTSSSVNVRLAIISKFNIPIALIESIDDKDFYSIAKLIDTASAENIESILTTVFDKLFNKTGIGAWFNNKGGIINKKKPDDKSVSLKLQENLLKLKSQYSFSEVAAYLSSVADLKSVRCYRKELLKSLCSALIEAQANRKTVYEAMLERRNHIRRFGRKIYGRCIGTTLLTKGLEFDTVVVLNADEFDCPKNLYVALTRATKRLIVFSKNPILSPKY